MTLAASAKVSRRRFLQTGTAGAPGLVIRFYLPGGYGALAAPQAGPFAPNAWIRVGTNGLVPIVIDKSEMGQGVVTSLPMLAADEEEKDSRTNPSDLAPADTVY